MPARMQDKVLLISGSTGIAAATARLAAAEGAGVFVTSQTESHCRALAQEIRAAGGQCDFHAADLTSPASAPQVVERSLARFGRIDALYNVVGVSTRRLGDGPLHACSEQAWDVTMNANLKSMFLLCRAVLRQMLAQPLAQNGLRGAILNMASTLAISPDAKHFDTHAYTTSKAAVVGLSKTMATYYAPHHIRVNAIAPSLVRTALTRRAQSDEELLRYVEQRQPLTGGMLEPEDIARASLFLLSDESRGVTGGLLAVDGGWCVTG